jgi:predicted permease
MNLLEDFVKDLRYASRQLRRTPGLTLIVVLSLALGIGANTAIFSAVEAVMLRPLPVKDPQQLLMLKWSAKEYPDKLLQDLEGSGGRSVGPDGSVTIGSQSFSYAAYEYLRDHNDVFASTFGVAGNNLPLNVGLPGHAEAATAQGVSGKYFEGIGVPAWMGRTIEPYDDQEGAPRVGVASFAFWQDKLGADPAAVGKPIVVNGHPWTIVGVAPRGFFGFVPGTMPDLWIPLNQDSAEEADLGNTNNGVPYTKDPMTWWVLIAGRLKPQRTEAEAMAELDGLFGQSIQAVARDVPENAFPRLQTFSLSHGLNNLRQRFSSSLFLLMAVVGLVLLIACGNVAGLLLARASARRREIAVRLSLGAGRSRLIRQLLVESLLLAIAGGAAGLLVAVWADSILLSLLSSGRSPIVLEMPLDPSVLLFALALSIVSGVFLGLGPAIRATRVQPVDGLKQGTGASRAGTGRSGKVLVASQIALCLVIVTSAGLFLRTVEKLQNVDIGFERDHLLLFTVRPGLNGYKEAPLSAYYSALQERVRALPGVQAVSFASRPPIGAGTGSSGGMIIGYTPVDSHISFYRHQIGPGYFEALGVPILAGRGIQSQDGPNSHHVVVINEKLAQTYFHGDNPLGHVMNFGSTQKPIEFEIVGVVKDVKYSQIRNDAPPTVYFSYLQYLSMPNAMTYEVRTAANPASLVEDIRRAGLALDRAVPVIDIKSQSDVIDQTVFLERTIAALTSAFGSLALLLACVGLYGTMSYAIAQRTREIGIRMALGAKRGDILLGVVRETLIITIAGLAIGLPLTLAATRSLGNQLFDLSPFDPETLLAAVIAISVVTLVAGYVPARRASTVAPIEALRTE